MEIIVAKGSVEKKTLQLSEGQQLRINIEERAQLQLLLEGGCGEVTTDVLVGKGATLDLCDLDLSLVGTTRSHQIHIRQEADSQVFVQSVSLASGSTTNTTNVDLCGEGAELSLNGLVIAGGSQHIDNHTLVQHMVPHTTSHQLFKYVLNEQSVGTYAGLVKVLSGAHHTVSEQTNRNLCTTREARMFAQPQLEIYNDDVRCNHGSSTGQLDESALFYMQQRGISLPEARLLLMSAFAAEVIDQIRIPTLRDRLHEMVANRFRNF
ncbi:MAG: SufD family Fe-S cluster assembly protein [Bacteroidaceae bacterium]|nr:SufD family Fe-S cluster assembly protein [Bacteroidaceae bacterium]